MIPFPNIRKYIVFFSISCALLLSTANILSATFPSALPQGRDVETYLQRLYKDNAELIADPIKLAQYFYDIVSTGYTTTYNFWLGASSSSYQFEGGNNETSAAEQFYKDNNLQPAGDAIDFWNRYSTDIPQMKNELGINCHRISLSWNKIEPQEGIFNREVLDHYIGVMKTYATHGITPLVNFHHYDEPQWFKQKGGFVHDENRDYFIRFVRKAYEHLHEHIFFISLCNSVEGASFKAHYTGDLFPGTKGNMQTVHECMANMDIAILESALAIREIYATYNKQNQRTQEPYIITQINILLFDPATETIQQKLLYPLSQLCCTMANMTQTSGTFKLFTTGEYKIYIPGMVNVHKIYKNAPQKFAYAFDAIGINHYSNNFMCLSKRLEETDPERRTESKNYRNYPEGLYRAVQLVTEKLAKPLGTIKNKNGMPMPIIITENGIATKNDAEGNKKRETYFQRTLFTIAQAIKDGYYVIGYLPWASHDNYEWPSKDTPNQPPFGHRCYGFFHVDINPMSPTYLQRTLKTGSDYFAMFAKQLCPSILNWSEKMMRIKTNGYNG